MTDPYDIAASRITSGYIDAIKAFWTNFEAHADQLDEAFQGRGDIDQSVEVMRPLQDISPDLMWEFGPSEKGHSLCVTSEWRTALRPLARAVINLAPNLERWEFYDARTPDRSGNIGENFEARFRIPITLSEIQVQPDTDNKIQMTGVGPGSNDEVGNQVLAVAGFLLGEQKDWDWFGDVIPKAMKTSLFSRFKRSEPHEFPTEQFVQEFNQAIEKIKGALPSRPYSDAEESEVSLLKFENGAINRPDLFTFSTGSMAYVQAALQTSRFSSVNHSRFGEWFLFLRIARSPETPFDQVDDRFELEEKLQAALSTDDIGGVVGAGHGHDAVYIDVALQDLDRGLRVIAETIGGRPFASEATIHFLEAGLPETGYPILEFGAAVS